MQQDNNNASNNATKEKPVWHWNRRELKKEARTNLKQNYWIMVVVCLIMAFLFAEYGNSLSALKTYNDAIKSEQQEKISSQSRTDPKETRTELEKFMGKIGIGFGKEEGFKVVAKRGNLSGVVKTIQEKNGIGAALYDLALRIRNHDGAGKIALGVLVLILNIFFIIFIKNLLVIGERRFFLENKNHPRTVFSRIFFLFNEGNIINPVKGMFMMNLFLSLWMLTIVGYIIKMYSYRLVPFILAENPDIKWRDAINLSREMMNGNKWNAFVLDISFWYWMILRLVTFGAVGVFFANPYMMATEAELYAAIRAEAYEKGIKNVELLNDDILYYPEDEEGRPIHPAAVRHPRERRREYNRKYSLVNIILMFFTFALVGWLWEVSLHLVKDHVFVNRGTMYGPWLPIYGAGGMLVLILLQKIREKKVLTFIVTFLLCGVLEYVTSWYLEYSKGTKWWDYSGYLLNINGRVCLEGLLIFAIGGTACIYIIAPFFDDLYNKIPVKVKWPIAGVLLAAFSFDMYYSHYHPNQGKGITDYGYIPQDDIVLSDYGRGRLIGSADLRDIPRLN